MMCQAHSCQYPGANRVEAESSASRICTVAEERGPGHITQAHRRAKSPGQVKGRSLEAIVIAADRPAKSELEVRAAI
jgi:hypothetical protein